MGTHLEGERKIRVTLPDSRRRSGRTAPRGTHELVGVFRPGQVAHLRPGVDALQRLPGERVPEAYAAVGCPTAGGEQSVLVRRPGDSFYCCKMLCVLLDRTQAAVIPDKELAERRDVMEPALLSRVCNTHKPRRCAGTEEGRWAPK